MESPRKRAWAVGGAPQDDDPADILVDDLKLDASFLQDELLDLPQLDADSLLALDSSADAFPGLDLFSGYPSPGGADAAGIDLGGLFAGDAGSLLPGGSSAQTRASPSTSESGNEDGGAAGVPSPTAAAAVAAESAGSEPPRSRAGSGGAASAKAAAASEDEAKRLARMQRNRENAFLSRQRKKAQMMELQQSCAALRAQATQLTCLVHRMAAENCLLRHHLGAACKTAGIPVPEVPSAMKPAVPAATAGAAPAPAPGVMLRPGVAVPIAAAQAGGLPAAVAAARAAALAQAAAPGAAGLAAAAAAPAPAPGPAPAPTPAVPARPTRAAKRARLTGAGAVFLAMFSVFLFAAPLGPGGRSFLLPATSYGSTPAPTLRYLPASSGDAMALEPLGPVSWRSRSLLEAATIEDSGGDVVAGAPVPAVAAMVNQTLEALLQDPRAAAVPERALRQLQDLAPAAVLLDAPVEAARLGGPAAADPLAAATAFPTLADQFFKAAGLDAPQTCQKVFEFDAATLPHPGRSRRNVERFITGTYGFKGRSVGVPTLGAGAGDVASLRLPALALPEAAPGDDDAADAEEGVPPADSLPVAVTEPTLVSVLLPTNASRGDDAEERGLTAVDRVFVVLLHPGDRFMTYSCGLSRPVLA